MPYSEITYCDISLSDFREERETSEDRVEYEDHRLETVRLNSGLEACPEELFRTCSMLILWNEQRAIRCVDYSKDIDTRIVHGE